MGGRDSHGHPCQSHSTTGEGTRLKRPSTAQCQPFLTSNTLDAGFLTSSRPSVRMWSVVWLGVVVSGWEEDRIPVSCPYSLSPRRCLRVEGTGG